MPTIAQVIFWTLVYVSGAWLALSDAKRAYSPKPVPWGLVILIPVCWWWVFPLFMVIEWLQPSERGSDEAKIEGESDCRCDYAAPTLRPYRKRPSACASTDRTRCEVTR